MSDKNNVSAAKPKIGGAISVAPVGTTLPTDATSALDAAFTKLGYISEDGLVNANTPETTVVKAWGGDTVLTTQTSKDDTFKYTLLEILNVDVLKYMYGDSHVSGTLDTGITVDATIDEPVSHAVVIDMIMSGGVLKRVVIPSCAATEWEDITYKDDTAIGYGVTVTAFRDANGSSHKEYIIKQAS